MIVFQEYSFIIHVNLSHVGCSLHVAVAQPNQDTLFSLVILTFKSN